MNIQPIQLIVINETELFCARIMHESVAQFV